MENKSWSNHNVREVPFWRDGMTPEEYQKEDEYYTSNYFNLVITGKYIPLWKQKLNSSKTK